jgi:hypothetical protein
MLKKYVTIQAPDTGGLEEDVGRHREGDRPDPPCDRR